MSSPHTQERISQDRDYSDGLHADIAHTNASIKKLMDDTVAFKEEQQSANRLELMNNLTAAQRRRLMSGEKLEQIVDIRTDTSAYYNTSDEAAHSIAPDQRFEYSIGDHLLCFEMNELKLDKNQQTITIPVVVYDMAKNDWVEQQYTIVDPDIFTCVLAQSTPEPVQSSFTDEMVQMVQFSDDESKPQPSPTRSQPSAVEFDDDEEERELIIYNGMDDKSVQLIQDKIYQQLGSVSGPVDVSVQRQIYNPRMKEAIRDLLDQGMFPFEVVNTLITNFL